MAQRPTTFNDLIDEIENKSSLKRNAIVVRIVSVNENTIHGGQNLNVPLADAWQFHQNGDMNIVRVVKLHMETPVTERAGERSPPPAPIKESQPLGDLPYPPPPPFPIGGNTDHVARQLNFLGAALGAAPPIDMVAVGNLVTNPLHRLGVINEAPHLSEALLARMEAPEPPVHNAAPVNGSSAANKVRKTIYSEPLGFGSTSVRPCLQPPAKETDTKAREPKTDRIRGDNTVKKDQKTNNSTFPKEKRF